MRDLDDRVQVGRERRHVPERHAADLPVGALGGHADEAGRRLEDKLRGRLGHRQHPGLEERRDDADRVRPGHPGIFDLLHDHVAGLGLRPRGRQDEVAVGGRVAARLAEHPQAEVVAVRLQPMHLLEHRRAGNVEHAADDDPAMFAGRVEVDRLDHPLESHGFLVA